MNTPLLQVARERRLTALASLTNTQDIDNVIPLRERSVVSAPSVVTFATGRSIGNGTLRAA